MTQRPAVSKTRRGLAAILTAATLATGGVVFALAEASSAVTTSATSNTGSTTTSGFGSTNSASSTSGSAQTTTNGS